MCHRHTAPHRSNTDTLGTIFNRIVEAVKMNRMAWQLLDCSRSELQLKATLTGGQSFRWKAAKMKDDSFDDESYIGVMANCVWQIRQNDEQLLYRVLGELDIKGFDKYYNGIRIKTAKAKAPKTSKAAKVDRSCTLHSRQYYEDLLRAYFRLDVDLNECYRQWTKAHTHFDSLSGNFDAIRVLDQDPVENLFSFICSQNNHISRISTLVEKLCILYGPKIGEVDGNSYYAFPSYEDMSQPEVEQQLRSEAFGYRAKFIQRAAAEIGDRGGLEWFEKIQNMSYKEAHAELIKLTGIGPKVADCICLMSLNHLEAIPVDTHVLKIAIDHYLPKVRHTKSMTPKLYNEIGDAFREVYGPMAGWAQTVLFCAELTKFKENVTNDTNDGCSRNKKRKK